MGAQILVIEDDADVRAEILDFLQRRRNTVRACQTLAEAEVALNEMSPDVVMSDICLPDGDGAVFCMNHAGQHDAKWLLMSGNQELVKQGNRQKDASENPALAILDKPVALRVLENFVRSVRPATR